MYLIIDYLYIFLKLIRLSKIINMAVLVANMTMWLFLFCKKKKLANFIYIDCRKMKHISSESS
jgi:hypothetical protein